jgi:DNA-binding HxlR family transcriptional regulator
VVRDLVMGKKTYSEFAQSPESIPTNILAERLKRLEAYGIIRKQQYQDNPVRYEYLLTEKGAGLRPVLLAMVKWGNEYIDGTLRPDEIQRMKEQYKKSK